MAGKGLTNVAYTVLSSSIAGTLVTSQSVMRQYDNLGWVFTWSASSASPISGTVQPQISADGNIWVNDTTNAAPTINSLSSSLAIESVERPWQYLRAQFIPANLCGSGTIQGIVFAKSIGN